MEQQTLYERVGAKNIKKLVIKFYDLVEQDERIKHLFKSDFEVIKRKQFMFLTQYLGGPPQYNQEFGHPRMRMRHLPHAITMDAATAWLENMQNAINSLPIDEKLKEDLYNAFPRLAGHMVNRF